ncbi:hypothetical protein HAX54_023548 [Datura stramonium]|uniref:Secreted protein n=1 Tax=Datura stramonium TaxID=4076 RepID=A0ABS8S777_DATST|nr:hypothetical protein [Datura stramonium]
MSMMKRRFYQFLSTRVAAKFAALALRAASATRASSTRHTTSALYSSVISSGGRLICATGFAMLLLFLVELGLKSGYAWTLPVWHSAKPHGMPCLLELQLCLHHAGHSTAMPMRCQAVGWLTGRHSCRHT